MKRLKPFTVSSRWLVVGVVVGLTLYYLSKYAW